MAQAMRQDNAKLAEHLFVAKEHALAYLAECEQLRAQLTGEPASCVPVLRGLTRARCFFAWLHGLSSTRAAGRKAAPAHVAFATLASHELQLWSTISYLERPLR